MNDIPGLLFTAAVLALCTACLRMGPGFKTWPRADKINYLVLVFSAWPWIILGFFTDHLPTWYTVTALTAVGASLVWFIVALALFLHQSRHDLRELQERYAAQFHRPEPDRPEQ